MERQSIACSAVKEISGRDQTEQFLRALPMIKAIKYTERRNVSPKGQWIEPTRGFHVIDNPSSSSLNAVKWEELVLGRSSPKMGTVFHMRPDLSFVKL